MTRPYRLDGAPDLSSENGILGDAMDGCGSTSNPEGAGSSPARGANLQVSPLSTWWCLLCGNPLAPTVAFESRPSVPVRSAFECMAPSGEWCGHAEQIAAKLGVTKQAVHHKYVGRRFGLRRS
jgi:hypothetical protein